MEFYIHEITPEICRKRICISDNINKPIKFRYLHSLENKNDWKIMDGTQTFTPKKKFLKKTLQRFIFNFLTSLFIKNYF
jgi:hypothetical protein